MHSPIPQFSIILTLLTFTPLQINFSSAAEVSPPPNTQVKNSSIKETTSGIEAHKIESQKTFKKLKAGFEYKGYADSPGHKAILEEMKKFYKKLVSLEKSIAKNTYPSDTLESLSKSITRVEKLMSYLVINDEINNVITTWTNKSKVLIQEQQTIKKSIETTSSNTIQTLHSNNSISTKITSKNHPDMIALTEQSSFSKKQVIKSGYYVPDLDLSDAANEFNTQGQYFYYRGKMYYYPYNTSQYKSETRATCPSKNNLHINLNF